MAKNRGLTPKQKRFVQEYLIDHNATAAYVRAGYSPKTAEVNASRMIRFDKVARAISEGEAKSAAKAEITREKWINEHACIAFIDPIDIYNDDGSIKAMKDIPERARRAIAEFTVAEMFDEGEGDQKHAFGLVKRIRLHSKSESLKQIGEACGFLKTKVEIDGSIKVRFIDHIVKLDK